MRECEEMLKTVQGCRDSRVTCDWQAAKVDTRVEYAGELKSHASCCTIGQKSQASQAVSSWLELATQSSREVKSPDHSVWEKLTFHIPVWETLTLRELPKRILREKP